MTNFEAQGEAIAKRIQETTEGFTNTFVKGKMYDAKEKEVKNTWVNQIDAANDEFQQWLSHARKK